MTKIKNIPPSPYLLILSAPSGAGKTTLCRKLLSEFPNFVLSISCTTRPVRGNEKNGVDYHFLTPDQFQKKMKAGDFAEWAEVHGNYYGTSKSVIQEAFQMGKDVLLDIDVQGAQSLKNAFPTQSFTIFIAPPSLEALEERLRGRGTETEAVIQKRMANAAKEMTQMNTFDKIIVNEELDKAYQELVNWIQKP